MKKDIFLILLGQVTYLLAALLAVWTEKISVDLSSLLLVASIIGVAVSGFLIIDSCACKMREWWDESTHTMRAAWVNNKIPSRWTPFAAGYLSFFLLNGAIFIYRLFKTPTN